MQSIKLFLAITATFLITSCASYDLSRRVVHQGNLLPSAKLDKLKIGMSKNDVAIVMGTSLLTPVFNDQRWDYARTVRKGGGRLEVKRVSLYFSGDVLTRIER